MIEKIFIVVSLHNEKAKELESKLNVIGMRDDPFIARNVQFVVPYQEWENIIIYGTTFEDEHPIATIHHIYEPTPFWNEWKAPEYVAYKRDNS